MWKITLPVMGHTNTVSCVLTVETQDSLLLIYLDHFSPFDLCPDSLTLAGD